MIELWIDGALLGISAQVLRRMRRVELCPDGFEVLRDLREVQLDPSRDDWTGGVSDRDHNLVDVGRCFLERNLLQENLGGGPLVVVKH